MVASGAKSLLDVEATAELLESLGVPVLGLRTDTLPRLRAGGGPPVSARVEDPGEAAAVARAHSALGRSTAVVLAQPAPHPLDVDALVEEEVRAAAR